MKTAIIGAGISGLVLAKNLNKAGEDVTVYEKESCAGGIARGYKKENWTDSVELFYHHWFEKDADLLALMDELGVRDKVVYRTPKTVMYHKGKFYPFDSILAALLYPGLGFGIHKVRFGLVGVYLRLTKAWKAFEKVTAKEWMTRYAGEFAYKAMWEPMMIGKFGEYADQVNMAWLWARIYSRSTSLGTYDGGMQSFFDYFTQVLTERGVDFRFDTAVGKVSRQDGKWDVDGESFDRVIVTTSPQSMIGLCPELPDDYRAQLAELKSIGAVVMSVCLKHPLSPEGYYWYNLPKQEGYPFLALVEHTNFVPKERFGGETVIYAGDYLPQGHPYFGMSEDELLRQLLPGLKKINPEFSEDWVISAKKFSAEYAQPIPFVDQSERIPDMQTPLDGLYFISMSQIYPMDRGMNFAIKYSNDLSRVILS